MSAKSLKLSDTPQGGTPTTTEDLIVEKIEFKERIKRLKEKSRVLRKETLEEIDRLEDPKQTEILEGFFIDFTHIGGNHRPVYFISFEKRLT